MTERSSASGDAQMSYIDENLARIRESIAQAAYRSGRRPEDVSLMAVTKTVPVERINHALSLGIGLIGENRVQELCSKLEGLNKQGLDIHLIGHLQRNKVRQVVGKVSTIQSLDSEQLAADISARSVELGIKTQVLLEINVGGEESKSGVTVGAARELIYKMAEMKGLIVSGIMIIPPANCEISETRRYFREIHNLFIDIGEENKDNSSIKMKYLSMGMSADYEVAVEEGSNLVRIGSALFGARRCI